MKVRRIGGGHTRYHLNGAEFTIGVRDLRHGELSIVHDL